MSDIAPDHDPAQVDLVYDGLQVRLQPAPFVKRVLALCVDYGVLGMASYLFAILAYLIGMVFFGGAFAAMTKLGVNEAFSGITLIFLLLYLALCLVVVMFIYHGYFIYFEFKRGATLGKNLFGMKVVTDDGSMLSLKKCFIRETFRYIDLLIVPGLIAFFTTDKKQRLGDIMAGTMVSYSQHKERSFELMYIGQEDYDYLNELLVPDYIDSRLAEDYLIFANQRFLRKLRSGAASDSEAQRWVSVAIDCFKSEKKHNLDDTTALLFFAELCFQQIKETDKK